MTHRSFFFGLMAIGGLAASSHAHHSYAQFDMTKRLTLVGTVKEFQWTNPHSWIQLVVTKDGKDEEWALEGGSPNMLFRNGWGPDIIKRGDKVTIEYSPIRDGSLGGEFLSVKTESGRLFKVGG